MPRSSTIATVETEMLRLRELIKPTGGAERVSDTAEAYAWCKRLALGHYENFPVGSILVPAHLRRHFFSVYAFSRLGDDIGDEPWTDDPEERLAALAGLDQMLDHPMSCVGHPVLQALHSTIEECKLPLSPFHRLIEAFRRDVCGFRPTTWEDVIEYCTFSANPVGELVLLLDGGGPPGQLNASNAICTALQITNFLQDLCVDRARGREYLPIPLNKAAHHARALYQEGITVIDDIRSRRLRWELRLIIAGGQTMLERCTSMLDELPMRRPILRKSDYFRVGLRALRLAVRASKHVLERSKHVK